MTDTSTVDLYYDPYDVAIDDDPYPVWKRMREEAPLYFNEKYNFYALSRYEDVARELPNWETYRSGRGTTADILFNNVQVPPGILLFEDPPLHDLHRRLLSRVFTPRRMLAVESLVREFCVRELDPLVGAGGFDFIADLGAMMPMRTIGYLLGIPEEDQAKIRDRNGTFIEMGEDSKPGEIDQKIFENAIVMFAEYIEWRANHPSDDLMTELLRAEIDEPDGTRRPLSRTEVLAYTAMIAGAGNETTARLIGFMGQLLSDHPDQRRELVADPSLIPGAIEETLRYEPRRPCRAATWPATPSTTAASCPRARSCCCSTVPPTATRVGLPIRTATTSTGKRAATSASGRACTSAWARRWPGWRRGSPSRRSSNAGPTGTSTTPTPSGRTPRACGGGRACPCSPDSHPVTTLSSTRTAPPGSLPSVCSATSPPWAVRRTIWAS
jgi:cytochrome P450